MASWTRADGRKKIFNPDLRGTLKTFLCRYRIFPGNRYLTITHLVHFMSIKSTLVRASIASVAWWLQLPCKRIGKSLVWNHICVPYLSWRDEQIISQTRAGSKFRVRPSDFVENRICFFGTWEPSITHQFENLLKVGDVVLDVGSNIGFYSVLSAKLVGPTGKVLAFEPSRSIRERLNFNLELNQLNNVEVVPQGAWHEPGQAVLNLVDGNRGSSSLGEISNSSSSESVELSRLDEAVPEELIERIRLLKIDVEGSEWAALQGASGLLDRASNIAVICEVCPERLATLSGSVEELVDFMASRGFSARVIPNDYSVEAYIAGKVNEPHELQLPLQSACDVLFERS